jgi:hypothetical protein
MAVGLGGIAVIRTDANYIGFTMATAIVMMSLGLVLFMAGMYGKVGTAEEARRAHEARLVL